MLKNNNNWFISAGLWVITGAISIVSGDYIGVIGCVFAIFMCCIYRDLLNKAEKLKAP